MITPEEISNRAARAYLPFLRGWLRNEPFAPMSFPVGSLPAEYRDLRAAVTKLLDHMKGQRGRGYRVEVETRHTRVHGTQSLPTRIVIDTPDDLLHLVGKAHEFALFCEDVTLIRSLLPQLEGWLTENPQRVIEQHGAWPELVRVCAYFLGNPLPGLYLRELPIQVHTKFIETHTGILRRLLDDLLPTEHIAAGEPMFERRYGLRYDEPLARLRFLDVTVQASCGSPLADISAPVSQLATLDLSRQHCVIVENKMTFLTLPPLPGAFALWGGGFAVEALAGLSWLRACPIWYWGDLDAQGFQILSRLRALFPQAVSLMMDEATFQAFGVFAGLGTPCPVVALPHLTEAEHSLFARLAREQTRLEQEHITQVYAAQRLFAAIY